MTHAPAQSASRARGASDTRFAGWLLALGALLGAVSGVLGAQGGALATAALPPAVAALVDRRPILAGDYARAVEMLAGDRREPLTPTDRAGVLERLIDEELLVESGLARGFLTSERSVRDAVTLAIVESVVAESASRAPTEQELREGFDAAREAAGNHISTEPFEAVRDGVEALTLERARTTALRAYLDELRARARIGCAEGARP